MNKRLIKDALIFGAGLYIGGMWVKAKVLDGVLEGLRNDIPEKKERNVSYRGYKCTGAYHQDRTLIFATRGDAEGMLSRMKDIVEDYGHITLADVCDLVGIVPNYKDNQVGWTDLRKACIARFGEGYMLTLPRWTHLDENMVRK